MQRYLYGESVKGATHVRNGAPLQDSYRIERVSDEVSIISVADGHGSEKCPRSKNGSQIAVNVFCKVMKEYWQKYEQQPESLITWLNREGELRFAQNICEEWQRRVRKSFNDSKSEKPLDENGKTDWKAVYKLYGTTLLGMMITPSYIFAFQLGDGDIQLVDQQGVSAVVETEKILGTETHSLSKMDAWRKAVSVVRRREAVDGLPYMYMLSTDGFANSYLTEEDFAKTCREYFEMIREHGFEEVCSNLGKWLYETSELGCGDDTTVLMAYFEGDCEIEQESGFNNNTKEQDE